MDSKPPSTTRKIVQAYAQAGEYVTVGMQFAGSILLCLLAGWWADRRLGTTPVFILTGTFLGAGAGFYHLYRNLVLKGKKKKENP